jgi:hypothetical protein
MDKLIFQSTVKYGVYMGLGFCAYTALMWLTKLDSTYLSIGQYLDMAIIILPLGMILWAIKYAKDAFQISMLQRFVVAIWVAAISTFIYDPFLYLYHHVINPNWFNAVLALKETELRAANSSQELIASTLQKMQVANQAQSGMFRLSAVIPSVIVLPILITLISFIFIRQKPKQQEKY